MDRFRGIVRPLLMITGWAMFCYFAFSEADLRQLFVGTVIGFSGWWFGERSTSFKSKRGAKNNGRIKARNNSSSRPT